MKEIIVAVIVAIIIIAGAGFLGIGSKLDQKEPEPIVIEPKITPRIDYSETKDYLRYNDITLKYMANSSFFVWAGDDLIYVDPAVVDNDPPPMNYILINRNESCSGDNIWKMQIKETKIIGPIECVQSLKGRAFSITEGGGVGFLPTVSFDRIPSTSKDFGIVVNLLEKNIKIYYSGDKLSNTVNSTDILVVNFENNKNELKDFVNKAKPKVIIPYNFKQEDLQAVRSEINNIYELKPQIDAP